jgi:hypothetical protein
MKCDQKALVRRYIEEVVNTGNLDRVADFVVAGDVENAKAHSGSSNDLSGPPR